MNLQQIKDERLEQAKNKIYAELMLISYGIILVSFCVKSLYFGKGLEECAAEYIVMLLAPIYQAVRSRQLGVVFASGKGASWRNFLYVAGVIIALFLLVLMRNRATGQSANLTAGLAFLGVYLALFALLRFFVIKLEQHRAERLAHQYDDEN